MLNFYKMSERDMILLSAAIAVILVDGLTIDEQNTLGNFIMCIGQNISSAAAQKAMLEENGQGDDVEDIHRVFYGK